MADPTWTRRRLLGVGAAGLAAVAIGGCSLTNSSTDEAVDLDAPYGGDLIDPPFAMPDATLKTVDGKPYDLRKETEGKLTFLFLGYTHCPDKCPVYLNTLARAREAVSGAGSRPTVLFVGVDVQRDTPEVLKSYLEKIDPTFIGLTGTEQEIADVNAALHFPPIVIGEPDANGEYEVAHYARGVAYTPDGKGRRFYDPLVRQQALQKDLPRLAEGHYR